MGIHMAAKDTQDIGQEYKAMKKAAKQQKKAHKKDKKKSKRERKYAKKEAKMRKKGVWLDDLTTQSEEEVEVVATAEEFEEKHWVRKSTDDIPLLEKKIDMMMDRKDKSGLHSMFEERFGESLMTPETYQEYELSESEKRRLEAIRAVEVEPEPVAVEEVPAEAAPAEAKKGLFKRAKKQAPQAEAQAERPAPVGELKPIYYPFQPWIYKKFSPGKPKVVQIILLLISIILLVLSLPFRLIIWIIIMIFQKIGSRKNKKEKKTEAEATPEA
jgi:hypothetical protein